MFFARGVALNLLQSLKQVYFFIEDKYYALLDKINEKVPVYKIIDPVDKVFPSMLVWLILFLAILAIFFFAQPAAMSGTIKVLSADQNAVLPDTTVFVQFDSGEIELTTNETGTANFDLGAEKKSARIIIEKNGYKKFDETVELNAKQVTEIWLLKTIAQFKGKKKIIILDAETSEKITNKTAAVSFSCSAKAIAPASAATSTSELDADYSEACGTMYASVSISGYNKKSNVALSQEINYIKMEKLDTSGKIRVTVKEESGNALSGVQLRLLDEDGTKKDEAASDASGTALFENVKPGTYKITALHDDGRFKKKEGVLVGASETVDVKIVLPDTIDGKKILIKVIDAETKEPINNAELTVFAEKDFLLQAYAEANGTFEKIVEDGKNYSLLVQHPSYVSKIVFADLKEQNDSSEQEIELEKTKDDKSNFGTANASVTDYDSKKAVADAEVLLYNKAYDWIPFKYPSKLTNNDGNTTFANLPTGTYFAKAKKGDSDGNSTEKSLLLGQTIELSIVLVIQTGDFEITVLDSTGTALKDANVSFIDESNGSILDSGKTNASGKIKSNPIKSDKIVYFKVKKDGFLAYKSSARAIMPKSTQKIEARLIENSAVANEKEIALRFKGFYKDSALTKKETILKSESAGTKYFLRFEIILAKDALYQGLKEHFRVGKNEQKKILDTNYSIKILGAEASPQGNSILSNCFDIANVFSNPSDCSDATKGAKLANTEWQTTETQGVLEEIAIVFIEPNLKKGTEIRFYYKAMANVNSTQFETNEFVKSFKIGDKVCEDDCPNFLWSIILQKGNEIEELDNFSKTSAKQLLLNADYNLLYSIINTKNTDYETKLTAENKNPNGVIAFGGNNAGAWATEIAAFTFNALTEKTGAPIQTHTATEAKFTEIELKLQTIPASADNNISLFFSVTADGSLVAMGLPKNLDPRVPNQEISAQIIDANTQLPVKSVVYRILKDNAAQPIATGIGNAESRFKYIIEEPAVNSVTVAFEKPGYRTLSTRIPVMETVYDPNFECISIDKAAISLSMKQPETIKIITKDCSENIEVKLSTELKTSVDSINLAQNDEALVTITADKKTTTASEVYAGEYTVFLKARFASDTGYKNAKKISVSIFDPNSCYSISKTTFDFSAKQNDSAIIKNKCQANVRNSFRPKIEIDSEKASVEFDPYNIPTTKSFNWNAKITGKERYLEAQFVDKNEQNWKQTAIILPNIPGDFHGTITTPIVDAKGAGRARFVSIYPQACVSDKNIAYIADTKITVQTDKGTFSIPMPCDASGCNWTGSNCKTRPEDCYGAFSKCQYSYIEFNLDTTQSLQSITAAINDPGNASLAMYDIFAMRNVKKQAEPKEQAIKAMGSTHSNTIGTEEGKTYYLGELDAGIKELENNKDYKQGYFRNAEITIENDSAGEVETWLQGNSVFARYLGKPIDQNGNIEFTITNISVENVEYAALTMQDYTNRKKT